MTFVVARPAGRWEIRESSSTPAGPRARTLATFRTLTPDIIDLARSRSTTPVDAGALRRSALRAGAPVTAGACDQAAGELLHELTAGRRPRPLLRRLLLAALEGDRETTNAERPSDSARAAASWLTATPQRRGETLRDLLLLADRLPASRASASRRFPRMESTPA